jgi:hypothetical protein
MLRRSAPIQTFAATVKFAMDELTQCGQSVNSLNLRNSDYFEKHR